MDEPAPHILAVDLGLRLGLALVELDGPIHWARSQHVRNASALKRAAYHAVRELREQGVRLVGIVAEGDRGYARSFRREAERVDARFLHVYAEDWRRDLLHRRQQRSGESAKKHADRIARALIDASGGPKPTSLRHDAAEAVLIGVWAAERWPWPDGGQRLGE